jgi:[protein-PII] uridylyltransferase
VVTTAWADAAEREPRLAEGLAVVAVGGYGRRELFPFSDVDLLFLLEGQAAEKLARGAIRGLNQRLWDCGMKPAVTTRRLKECARFDPANVEFMLALLDHRLVAGDAGLYRRLAHTVAPELLERERQGIAARLVEVTRVRHAKYGETLFHLEPNVKDCPGGLRDVHVCGWLARLQEQGAAAAAGVNAGAEEFAEAREFLCQVRWFLHRWYERDNNQLDWLAQDAAAARGLGLVGYAGAAPSAAYWMRFYFRHARSVERRVKQAMEEAGPVVAPVKTSLPIARRPGGAGEPRPVSFSGANGFQLRQGWIALDPANRPEGDPAHDPESVLEMFGAMAWTGAKLSRSSELRVEQALPLLSERLEDGPALRRRLAAILTGPYAGTALRSMHALGTLELLIPEFHGIDALVIRDAYHRYTVDEHTFVVIDTLHGLEGLAAARGVEKAGEITSWAGRFGAILRDLPHPELLYLAALLHDTGKGRSSDNHTRESVRMAETVLGRLELDPYECGLVVGTIRNHLEMSAALRRDVFDKETVQTFAGKVQTPEALRMLALFTYADICAVNPGALTPWKAENLWRLYLATADYLDRSVDEERVGGAESELVHRVAALLPGQQERVRAFLEGFPERYVRTRTPDQVRTHFLMAERLGADGMVELDFRYGPHLSEITLVTRDRPLLFAGMAGALAAAGMNIVTADAFSNRQGLVVDSFRFTDSFRTLEMNASEREALVENVRGVMLGRVSVEKLLAGRRHRPLVKVKVEARVDFDRTASSHSTLLQVVAQDTPGLLHALSRTMGERGCNIEVALVDTEGEMAIDVFYVTQQGAKLESDEEGLLRQALLEAMEENAG